jgi:hypothetical protein
LETQTCHDWDYLSGRYLLKTVVEMKAIDDTTSLEQFEACLAAADFASREFPSPIDGDDAADGTPNKIRKWRIGVEGR